jgi:hypothetical protein
MMNLATTVQFDLMLIYYTEKIYWGEWLIILYATLKWLSSEELSVNKWKDHSLDNWLVT